MFQLHEKGLAHITGGGVGQGKLGLLPPCQTKIIDTEDEGLSA